jgi:hypothetical protein
MAIIDNPFHPWARSSSAHQSRSAAIAAMNALRLPSAAIGSG